MVICSQSVSERLVELVSFSNLMTAGVTGDVTAQFYEGDLEFGKRFPSLSGKLLIDAIMRADTLPMTRTIPFFSSSGEWLLFRHADTNQLRNEGLVPGVRGLPWCTPRRPTNTGDREVAYDLMTFASLTEALYQAHQRWPNDAQNQATI